MGRFEYLAQHPEAAQTCQMAMSGVAAQLALAALQAYGFGQFEGLVDVGAGHGALMTAILQTYLKLRGLLFDQDFVITGAKPSFERAGLAFRCQFVAGNFLNLCPAVVTPTCFPAPSHSQELSAGDGIQRKAPAD